MKKFFKKAFAQIKDPRYFQIIFLGSFLSYGAFQLGWSIELKNYILLISTCLIVQTTAILYLNLPWSSLRSALITSLGLCLLFKAGDASSYVLAGMLAIGSKFAIRYKGKHIFNPANFGIIVPIILTGQTWISPGQWGSSLTMLLFFGAAGLMILFRISRLETGLTFLLVYFVLLMSKDVFYAGWNLEVVMHKMTNGALLLFAFFMITDPMTIPNKKKVRIAWASCLAIVSFLLSNAYYFHTAPMWILFLASPLVPVLDYFFKAEKFKWLNNVGTKKLAIKTN